MIVKDFPKTTSPISRVRTWAVVVAVYGAALPLAAQTVPSSSPFYPPAIDPPTMDAPAVEDKVEFRSADSPYGLPSGDDGDDAELLRALLQRRAEAQGLEEDRADDEPLTAEQKQAAQLLQRYVRVSQLQRSPAGVLNRLAAAAAEKGDGAAAPDPKVQPDDQRAQQFYQRVLTGDWDAVRQYLGELPGEVGPKVYDHLLILLAQGGQVVLPAEIPQLADASPADLGPSQLTMLGHMLLASQARIGKPKAMLATIAAGTRRLGGSAPDRRLAAARLLIAAKMIPEAGPYLPDLDEVRQKEDPVLINLHASYQQALGRRKDNEPARQLAWELTQTVLDMDKVDDAQYAEALKRTMSLMPSLPEETVSKWLRGVFTRKPALGMAVLATVAQQVESIYGGKATQSRASALAVQKQVVGELLAVADPGDQVWSTAIQMMTLGWLKEAQLTVAFGGHPLSLDAPDAATGSPTANGLIALTRNDKIRPVPAKLLCPLCPGERWCQAVDADMARQLRCFNGQLAALAGDREQTFAIARYFADTDPNFAKRLLEQYVLKWVEQLGEEPDVEEIESVPRGYSISRSSSPYASPSRSLFGLPQMLSRARGTAISLTRAMQVRNLDKYAELLGAIELLGTPALDEETLVTAFGACHSPAEVYRAEDVQRAFGDLDGLRPETAFHLASAVRTRLAGQWRRQELQEQMNTRRTDKEQVAEVKRGYDLSIRLAITAIEQSPGEVKFPVLLASLYYAQAEFLYGQEVDLQTYTAVRDRAFATYRQAAEMYAESMPTRKPEEQSVLVFQQWFASALGASDLAYLTRQQRPNRDQIEQITAAIHALGAEAADRHLAMFGKAVGQSIVSVPPQLKPHYLREALRIVGDHPGGEKARRRLAFYDELLAEVRLHLAVDGRAEVGHGCPFGVLLSIRGTNALGRESDGFAHLLQKSYSPSTGREIDHKELLEQTLRERLTESFEIDLIRFHDPNVQPRGFGRPGWKETPLAYLMLHCKDASVDRIPSVHVDLEFNDGSGAVLLPIPSQVVLIDAREADPDARPFADLQLKQILDDRRLEEGAVRLEVEATAKGLIPDLDRLLQIGDETVPGFAIAQIEDLGLEIDSLDTAGDRVRPACSRRWIVELKLAGETPVDRFVFPKPADASVTVAYQRYDDADLADADSVVPLRVSLLPGLAWWWTGCGLAGLLLLGVGTAAIRRYRRRRRQVAAPAYRRPDPLTPFNLIVLLKRIHSDGCLELAPQVRDELAATIGGLQRRFFTPDGAPGDAAVPDLTTLTDQWLAHACNGRTSVALVKGRQEGVSFSVSNS